MSLPVQFNGNQLCFNDFLSAPLEYKKEVAEEEEPFFEPVRVKDLLEKKILFIFLRATDLEAIGFPLNCWRAMCSDINKISTLIRSVARVDSLLKKAIPIVSDHLTEKHLESFKNMGPLASSIIVSFFHAKDRYNTSQSKGNGHPGIYLDNQGTPLNIFINLKETPCLGKGGFGKIRKVLWLNPPGGQPRVIAKKTILPSKPEIYKSYFEKEIASMREFPNKKGIISLIAGGYYGIKQAIFMPLYPIDSYALYAETIRYPINAELDMISQWLDGLATISEKGIHGDIKLENLCLRETEEEKIEAVIIDFGLYALTLQIEPQIEFISPEYKKGAVSKKYDVWGMGICLSKILLKKDVVPTAIQTEAQMKQWTSNLAPNWVIESFSDFTGPIFVVELINQMLDPRPENRIDAKAAFSSFSKDYQDFLEKSSKPPAEVEKRLESIAITEETANSTVQK